MGLIKLDKFGREGIYYTRFNGCVVFPLLDQSGQVVSLYGRHTIKQEHQKAIAALRDLKEVVLDFDGDAAGKEALPGKISIFFFFN